MKTTSIEINGKRYLLCFSLRVIRSCTERYKSIEEIGSAIDSEDKLQNVYESVWIIAEMMKAGERYAKLNGLDAPEALSEDVLLDVFDVRDAALLVEKIQETILARNIQKTQRPRGRRNNARVVSVVRDARRTDDGRNARHPLRRSDDTHCRRANQARGIPAETKADR